MALSDELTSPNVTVRPEAKVTITLNFMLIRYQGCGSVSNFFFIFF